ncbi:hypothetical protein V6N13_110916 [Hibiscus sabdariffa]|uniref:Uncharacterized protein n=1 Tax=Hibiscus sabdariffa TaxID=183260 RepID=A0ABR2TJA9_9ROSI
MKYRIEINVAVNVVMDVFGKPEIVRRRQVSGRREGKIFIAISSHFLEADFEERSLKRFQFRGVGGRKWEYWAGTVAEMREPPRVS